jgi:hypothetical protein
MIRRIVLLFAVPVLVLFVAGCGNDSTPLESNKRADSPVLQPKIIIPAGATLDSATFNIYVTRPNSQVVNLHRVTADWDETSVTWNSLGSDFATEVSGFFTAAAVGWHSADITALVQDWLDGTYDDYGVVLDQVDQAFPRAIAFSRESGIEEPFLEVCYILNDDTTCEQTVAMADAYIYEADADLNFGDGAFLYTGWEDDDDPENRALLRFELEIAPDETVSLGDFVWHDENQDGLQDGTEMGIEGVTVNLYDCQDNMIAAATTDENGHYLFSELDPGDYYVEFIIPQDHVFSPQDQGIDDAVDSDADPTTGKTDCITLEADGDDLTRDAGLYVMAAESCTYSKGYWKNHAGFGPQDNVVTPLLPIWLGNDDGDKGIPVTDSAIAVDVLVMKTYGYPSNGFAKLYAQLLAAKLNVANGADDSEIADYISTADDFLSNYDWNDWDSLDKEDRQMINDWMEMFDGYNNGNIGPGHCDDMYDEFEYDDENGKSDI